MLLNLKKRAYVNHYTQYMGVTVKRITKNAELTLETSICYHCVTDGFISNKLYLEGFCKR